MNVTTEDIRKIPPGRFVLIPCEDGASIRSARSLVSIVKETGCPKDVVNYETKKIKTELGLHFGIFAMREGDKPIFCKLFNKV